MLGWFLPLLLCCATLEEKVGQLLLVHFHGSQVNAEAERLVREAHVGGFVLFAPTNDLSTPEQIADLCSGLHTLGPLLIAVDQEGNRVNHLPPPFAQELGPELAAQMRAVGLNLNLAPMVDQGMDYARLGLNHPGVGSVLKHFPGHGSADGDSHQCLPLVTKSLEELWADDLLPYIELAEEADGVMLGHLLVPAIDPDRPASRSRAAIQLLRHEIGFDGVILTDSVVMQGFFADEALDEAIIQALEAGCDMVMLAGFFPPLELTTDDVLDLHHTLVEAVKSGRISIEQIDESVSRVLQLKKKLGVE